jgi:hypothetical protein
MWVSTNLISKTCITFNEYRNLIYALFNENYGKLNYKLIEVIK